MSSKRAVRTPVEAVFVQAPLHKPLVAAGALLP